MTFSSEAAIKYDSLEAFFGWTKKTLFKQILIMTAVSLKKASSSTVCSIFFCYQEKKYLNFLTLKEGQNKLYCAVLMINCLITETI